MAVERRLVSIGSSVRVSRDFCFTEETVDPMLRLTPDLNTRFLQTIDSVLVPAKFKLAWHYALGGRGVFLRIWTGVAAVVGPGGRGAGGGQGRILKALSPLARRRG